MSGYVACACRDCFDIAIASSNDKPTLCADCREAGCDVTGQSECERENIYGEDSDNNTDKDEKPTMQSVARINLIAQARAYLEVCERDREAAERRVQNARAIYTHLTEGKKAGNSPTPVLNESGRKVERFAARVDALLTTVYAEEEPDHQPIFIDTKKL